MEPIWRTGSHSEVTVREHHYNDGLLTRGDLVNRQDTSKPSCLHRTLAAFVTALATGQRAGRLWGSPQLSTTTDGRYREDPDRATIAPHFIVGAMNDDRREEDLLATQQLDATLRALKIKPTRRRRAALRSWNALQPGRESEAPTDAVSATWTPRAEHVGGWV